MESYVKAFNHFMRETRGIRRLGSAAVDLAYVACGRFDGFFEYSLNAWDVAAGMVIIQNAGGKASDFSGGKDCLFGKEMVASNNFIHKELLSVINDSFGHN
jgi:myo-inositol-1(or 4)-monophosphatase